MLRASIATGFLLISALVVWLAFQVGVNTSSGTLFVNLGTEIFGILITVALVEWLFERRRLQDRGRELAWSVLHAIERVVWIWQGGPHQLGTEELLGLVRSIRSNDPVAPFTEALLVNVGTQCREALQREPAVLRSLPGLAGAMTDLTSLSSLRDGRESVSIHVVAEVIESGTLALAQILNQPTRRLPGALIRLRNPGLESQQRRYYDSQPAATALEPLPEEDVRVRYARAATAPQPAEEIDQ